MKLNKIHLRRILAILMIEVIVLDSCLSDEKQFNPKVEKLTATTDKELYHNEIVTLTISNNSDSDISMLMYNSAFRDKIVNNKWELAANTIISDPEKDTVILFAEHTVEQTIFTAKPGIYRVGIPFLWDGGPERKDTLYSNEFEVY